MPAPNPQLPHDFTIPAQVMEELIAWSIKLGSGSASAEDEQGFKHWRAKDATHEMAWQKLNTMEQDLSAVPVSSRPLVTQTIALVDTHNATKRAQAFKQISLLSIVAISTIALLNQLGPWQQQSHYATTIGQQATYTLADGTQLTLNTNTSVDVHYALFKREIILNAGEIYLETGKDTQGLFGRRAFWVNTPQASLEAIGTRFSVYKKDTNTHLHVTEGIVAMHSGEHAPVRAYANESYSLQGAASVPIKTDGQFQDQMAWLEGVIVARQMRLDELMAELSRYQALPVSFNADAGALQVSGVFQVNRADPAEHALHTIAQTLPIRVTKQNGNIVIRKK